MKYFSQHQLWPGGGGRCLCVYTTCLLYPSQCIQPFNKFIRESAFIGLKITKVEEVKWKTILLFITLIFFFWLVPHISVWGLGNKTYFEVYNFLVRVWCWGFQVTYQWWYDYNIPSLKSKLKTFVSYTSCLALSPSF